MPIIYVLNPDLIWSCISEIVDDTGINNIYLSFWAEYSARINLQKKTQKKQIFPDLFRNIYELWCYWSHWPNLLLTLQHIFCQCLNHFPCGRSVKNNFVNSVTDRQENKGMIKHRWQWNNLPACSHFGWLRDLECCIFFLYGLNRLLKHSITQRSPILKRPGSEIIFFLHH